MQPIRPVRALLCWSTAALWLYWCTGTLYMHFWDRIQPWDLEEAVCKVDRVAVGDVSCKLKEQLTPSDLWDAEFKALVSQAYTTPAYSRLLHALQEAAEAEFSQIVHRHDTVGIDHILWEAHVPPTNVMTCYELHVSTSVWNKTDLARQLMKTDSSMLVTLLEETMAARFKLYRAGFQLFWADHPHLQRDLLKIALNSTFSNEYQWTLLQARPLFHDHDLEHAWETVMIELLALTQRMEARSKAVFQQHQIESQQLPGHPGFDTVPHPLEDASTLQQFMHLAAQKQPIGTPLPCFFLAKSRLLAHRRDTDAFFYDCEDASYTPYIYNGFTLLVSAVIGALLFYLPWWWRDDAASSDAATSAAAVQKKDR